MTGRHVAPRRARTLWDFTKTCLDVASIAVRLHAAGRLIGTTAAWVVDNGWPVFNSILHLMLG